MFHVAMATFGTSCQKADTKNWHQLYNLTLLVKIFKLVTLEVWYLTKNIKPNIKDKQWITTLDSTKKIYFGLSELARFSTLNQAGGQWMRNLTVVAFLINRVYIDSQYLYNNQIHYRIKYLNKKWYIWVPVFFNLLLTKKKINFTYFCFDFEYQNKLHMFFLS